MSVAAVIEDRVSNLPPIIDRSFVTSSEASDTTRFSTKRLAACFVNEMARFCVFLDVICAIGM